MFDRFKLLVGSKFVEVANKTVLVIGLGGVGSYTVESLVRCGVLKLILVDGDLIDVTNLNRQLMTRLDNIGTKKTDAWLDRIKSINPDCEVILIDKFINATNIEDLFNYNIDYIVDACDTVATKVLLIDYSNRKGIKLISCMGTGNKMDPSKLEIMDIYKTSYDPLAKVIRRKCRELGIKRQLVVCSKEKPIISHSDTIPSNSFVPASAGLLITSYIIRDIVGDLDV